MVYEELSKVSNRFTIAAAFGNVHGVYKPGNVKLQPIILKNSQDYVAKNLAPALSQLILSFTVVQAQRWKKSVKRSPTVLSR
jgi:fructose/tagatose bisphosphate aldolase